MQSVLAKPQKEERDSAVPSSQRQAVMDRGHSPNGEEVVMATSQVVVSTSQKSGEAVGCHPNRPCEEKEEEGYTQLCAAETIGQRVRVLTRHPLKEKESREIDRGLLKYFLLLQTVYPAICNIAGEKSVADHANALRVAGQKRGRKRKHHQR